MSRRTPPTSDRLTPARSRRGRTVPQRRRNPWLWLGPLLALVILAAGGIALARRGLGSGGPITGVATFGNLSKDHQAGALSYPQTPPVGGTHNPVWQNCGIYDAPILDENALHSLEHGAVWIAYRPDLAAAAVEQLRSLVRGRGHALLSPYAGLPAPVVASAWGVQLKVDSAADARLAQFVAKYEQGLQTPEPGATCQGGTGTPKSS